LPAVVVDWGPIADAGYVSEHPELLDYFRRSGLRSLTSLQATQLLKRLLVRDLVSVTAASLSWSQIVAMFPHVPARYELVTQVGDGTQAGGKSTARIIDQISGLATEERPAALARLLAAEMSGVTGIDPDALDLATPINQLGVDSLMTVELKNRIEKQTGINLPVMEIMRGPSIDELARLILVQLDQAGADGASMPAPVIPAIAPAGADNGTLAPDDADRVLDRLDDLSEAEIDAMLAQLERDDPPENGSRTPAARTETSKS
jgi:acyl carrier protein